MPKFIPTWNELTEDEQRLAVKFNNFFCGLHLLVNFAECISPILEAFEKLQGYEKCELDDESEDEKSSDITIYSSDPL